MRADRRRGTAVLRVFSVPEFRALWFAHSLSLIGDQFARVALAILVFDRTGSAGATAVTYSLTYVPAVVGGPLLSGLADRFPRRTVMVVADVVRAVLVAAMALPGMPFPVLCVLLVLVVLANAPFNAARLATMPDALEGDAYEAGLAVTSMTQQSVQLLGFGLGGVLVAATSAQTALVIDAGTFAVSALVIGVGMRLRPAPSVRKTGTASGSMFAAMRLVWADRRLRTLFVLGSAWGFYVVPEALAAPYAAEMGEGPAVVGVLMAADPLSGAVGAWLLVRWVPASVQARLIAVLPALCGAPLVLFALNPSLVPALGLLALSGLASAYLVSVHAAYVRAVPDDVRGGAVGLASAGLLAAQGLAILLAGGVAQLLDPGPTIAVFAAAGVAVSAVMGLGWHRLSR
ncbi:MFS transporter [Nonomuraea sp. NPDC050790]|uniref:MFS transporter n=1 Tax=Nonomuraea sp. NPDC050790 TaxID=3364371 RepID=UPI00379061D1